MSFAMILARLPLRCALPNLPWFEAIVCADKNLSEESGFGFQRKGGHSRKN